MKKRIRKQIPAYAFGANTGNIVDGASGLASLMPGGKSTATTQSEVVSQSIADVGKGAASGMKIGAAFGPIGAAVGAVGGAIVGSIGKKGGINETEGFTEDNTYTLNTGFMALGNKKLQKKIAQDKARVQANRIAVEQTAELQSEWDEENQMDTNTFAFGGELDYDPAYVDDGELLKTPDGQVSKVPENGQPTDSNLMNLPNGTRILSDKLKVPGTNKTFAQMGEKIMTKRKSKGTDKFAENSKKLNEMNNSMIHDQLFDMQEQIKATKGIRNKTKAFAKGGEKQPYIAPGNVWTKPTQQAATRGFDASNLKTIGTGATSNVSDAPTASSGFDWQGAVGSIGSLAPAIANLFPGEEESARTVHNPYSNTIQRTMRKRRFDIDPALKQLGTNRAVSDYSASQQNTNTGSNMAYRLQSAINLDKQTTDLYSQASNIQNQYDADYANTMNNLGQQYVGAVNMAEDMNARNRAATRNIKRAGLSQISDFSQNQQLMSNQKSNDQAMLEAFKPMLEAGYTKEQLAEMLAKFKR